MDPQDLERIIRAALRELGAGEVVLTVDREPQPDRWRIAVTGALPATFILRAGRGTSAQFIRQQIFDQFSGR